MQSRRAFTVVGLALLLPWRAKAQAAAFVGSWQGEVQGIGAVRLFVTAVRPDGSVEGKMEHELQSFASTFGEKADSVKSTSHGVAKGVTLMIEAALGGRYELTLEGNRLSGVYARGTTYQVPVTFTKF